MRRTRIRRDIRRTQTVSVVVLEMMKMEMLVNKSHAYFLEIHECSDGCRGYWIEKYIDEKGVRQRCTRCGEWRVRKWKQKLN